MRSPSIDKISIVSDDEEDQTVASSNSTIELIESSEQSDDMDELELLQDRAMKEFRLALLQTRSVYRRRNYKFLKCEPKKVYF